MTEDFRRLKVSRLPFSFGMIYLSHKRTYVTGTRSEWAPNHR